MRPMTSWKNTVSSSPCLPKNFPTSSGTVNVSRGTEFDRRIRLAELILRLVVFFVAVISTVLIATDSEVRLIFSIRKKAKFTDMKVLIFIVVVNVLGAAYSALQLVRLSKGSLVLKKPLAWTIFSSDQILAYLMFSAVAASIPSAVYAQYGEPQLQWMKTCDFYRNFCNRMGEGMVGSVFVCMSMIGLSGLSAFSLFRLYNGDAGKIIS